MKVRMRLFAVLREIVGREELEIEVSEGTTVGGLLETVVAEHPRLVQYRGVIQVAVNQELADRQTRLQPGDDVALLPPVSGG